MFSKKVLVADEAIWVRDGNGVRRIPWFDVLDVKVESAGLFRASKKMVIRCKTDTVTLPMTPELAEKVRVGSYSVGRAGGGSRR